MDKIYCSKVDRWVWLVIGIGIIVICVSSVVLLVRPPQGDMLAGWIALASLLLAAFMAWTPFVVRYTVTTTHLLVRAAVFRWRIPLDQIVEVHATHNPLSSPALSLDRLRINCKRPSGRTWWIMISPKGKEQFLDDLAEAAGLEKDGNRLVRRN